jgi:hypothetical protein
MFSEKFFACTSRLLKSFSEATFAKLNIVINTPILENELANFAKPSLT